MQHVDVSSWEQFEEKLRELTDQRLKRKDSTSIPVSPFLYRGQGNQTWQLATTLERKWRSKISLKQYFRLISRVRPQIETFTGITWDVPQPPAYDRWLRENDTMMPCNLLAYDFMVCLRHHGFPSPLLDWTRSPYVAAYFAFASTVDNREKISIYVLWERPGGIKVWSIGNPQIHSCGPYVRSHKRHFLQQSEYTICLAREDEWFYVPHENAFVSDDPEQNILWKLDIPATERLKVLKLLDHYNLNAFSLFGSEESLMETMALRELQFREDHES